jgi:hypothetical protein
LLDLGPRGRAIACLVFFGSEAVLIATADLRSDRSYGFRMFPESSSITVHVSRRLSDDSVVPVEQARWKARDCSGAPHTIIWGKMVRSPAPWRLDAPVGAPYGIDSEVHRTRDALRWVLDHTPDDCETRGFVATIDARRNGQPATQVTVEAARDPGMQLVPAPPRATPAPAPPPPSAPTPVAPAADAGEDTP